MSFCVYGFLTKVHPITTVLPVKSLVFGLALQYRAMSFSHHLSCDVLRCSCVRGMYFPLSQVVPEDTAKSGILPG